jgi:hypothetical protein
LPLFGSFFLQCQEEQTSNAGQQEKTKFVVVLETYHTGLAFLSIHAKSVPQNFTIFPIFCGTLLA